MRPTLSLLLSALLGLLALSSAVGATHPGGHEDPWGPGSYIGSIAPSSGENRVTFYFAAPAGYGVGFQLSLPIEHADSTSVWVDPCQSTISYCKDERRPGYVRADDGGQVSWEGGARAGSVRVSLTNFYYDFSFDIEVYAVAMSDVLVSSVAIGEPTGSETTRIVSARIENQGTQASTTAQISFVSRQYMVSEYGPQGTASYRLIATLDMPALLPGESTMVRTTWETRGQVGWADIVAEVAINDARWDNNEGSQGARTAGPATGQYLVDRAGIDILNMRPSAQLLGFWHQAGTSSPNGNPGISYRMHDWDGARPSEQVVYIEAGTSLENEIRAKACIYTTCIP